MRKWILVMSLVLLGALAFAACGDDNGDTNTESAQDGDSLPPVGDDVAPSFGTEYRLTISFNEQALDRDVAEIGRILEQFDDSTEYVVQESFPLTGVANLITDVESFCSTVVGDIEALEYVTAASCGPQLEPGDADFDDVATGDLDDGVSTSPGCEVGATDCNDTPDTCFGDDCTGTNGSEGDQGITVSPVCAPDVPDCVDTLVNTCDGGECTGDNDAVEDLPLAPPAIRPAADGQYTITIRFNETVQQDELDEVGAMIRDFDPDAEYVIQESFPPTGVANFNADTEDACLALTQELEEASFVTSVSCGPQLEPGDAELEEPVVNDLE